MSRVNQLSITVHIFDNTGSVYLRTEDMIIPLPALFIPCVSPIEDIAIQTKIIYGHESGFMEEVYSEESMSFFHSLIAGSGQAEAPGLTWLKANAFYHDYNRLEGGVESIILAGDDGLLDLGQNGINGTPLNDIIVGSFVDTDGSHAKCLKDTSNDAISIGRPAALISQLSTDFEIHLVINSDDGQAASSWNVFGALTSTTTGASRVLNCFVEAVGNLNLQYASGANQIVWRSTNPVFTNGITSKLYIRFVFDFTTDVITVYVNNVAIAGGLSAGTGRTTDLTTINPATFSLNHDIYIGALNNAGTITTNTNVNRIVRFAITPLLTGEDETNVTEYFPTITDNTTVWSEEFHVTAANADTKRSEIRTAVFGTYPTNAAPAATAAVASGTIHGVDIATLTGFASVTRLTFTRDGASNKIYRIVNSSPNGKIVFVLLGHSPIDDVDALNAYLAAGYDIMWGAQADTGDTEDLSDNTASGTWTPVHGGNHDEMASLGVAGLSYFLYDKIEAKNYLLANFAYTNIFVTGISGGGWMALWLAALDEDFEKSAPVRGFILRNSRVPLLSFLSSDYEQGATNNGTTASAAVAAFYDSYTYADLVALATTGGRTLKVVTHFEDSVGLGHYSFNKWKSRAESVAAELGGTFKLHLSEVEGQGLHTYWSDEIQAVTDEFNL